MKFIKALLKYLLVLLGAGGVFITTIFIWGLFNIPTVDDSRVSKKFENRIIEKYNFKYQATDKSRLGRPAVYVSPSSTNVIIISIFGEYSKDEIDEIINVGKEIIDEMKNDGHRKFKFYFYPEEHIYKNVYKKITLK